MRRRRSALGWRHALALAALALLVRLPGLGRSLWYDELFTLAHFASSPTAALGAQRAANNHPPASLLAWAVGHVSSSEVALRLPFALAGALAAGALALGVGRAFGARAGWAAGALLAVAPLHVLASQQVRGYALMSLGAALALGGLLALLGERGASRRGAALLASGLSLGVWAHPTLAASALGWSAALALAVGLAHEAPLRRSARQALVATLAGLAGGLLLAAPVLGRTWKFARANVAVAPASGLHPGPLAPRDLAAALGAAPSPLALALAALAALGLVALARRAALHGTERRLAGALLAAPLLAAAALVAGGALGYPRFLLFALPGALALAGLGLAALARRRAGLATVALAGCVLLATPGAGAGEELQDLRGAARQAAGWSARLEGAPVLGVGPGGELLTAYLPAARPDPTGAAAAERAGPAVFVIPLPAWLETAPAPVRAALAEGEPRLLLPGRESPVLLVVRPGR